MCAPPPGKETLSVHATQPTAHRNSVSTAHHMRQDMASTPTSCDPQIDEGSTSPDVPGQKSSTKGFQNFQHTSSSPPENAPNTNHGTTPTINSTLQSLNIEDRARPRLVTFQPASMEDFHPDFHTRHQTKPISMDQGTSKCNT